MMKVVHGNICSTSSGGMANDINTPLFRNNEIVVGIVFVSVVVVVSVRCS